MSSLVHWDFPHARPYYFNLRSRTLPAKDLESVMEGARLMNCMFEAYYQMIFCNKEGRCKNGIVSKHAILSIHQDSVERIGMTLSGVELAWNE